MVDMLDVEKTIDNAEAVIYHYMLKERYKMSPITIGGIIALVVIVVVYFVLVRRRK